MFDSVVIATNGLDFYAKAFIDLDESAINSPEMAKAFENLVKLAGYADPAMSGREWNLATAMVVKGDALLQVMGDWAKASSMPPTRSRAPTSCASVSPARRAA
jgi:glucose/mannose transport system substrate-binding protein